MKELEQEIAERVAIMQSDPDFIADNPNADFRQFAISDIVGMGSDYSGAYPDPVDAGNKAWGQWKRIYRAALKESR